MKITGSIALVSGANRGLGARIVDDLVARGAAKIYAGARDVGTLTETVERHGNVVVPVRLDVNDPDSIAAAAATAHDITLLVNNAGILNTGGPLDATIDSLRAEMETNYIGMINMAKGFVPTLERNRPAAIANILTIIALAPMPGMGGYSASKAAAHSLTQTLRHELAPRGITVHGIYPGGIDTDMLAAYDVDKADPTQVARALLDGIETDTHDIAPDDFASHALNTWTTSPKALETMITGP